MDLPSEPVGSPPDAAPDPDPNPDPAPAPVTHFLLDQVPEGATLQVAVSALRERIYGSIACLSTLLIITGYQPLEHPWEKVVDVLIATGGLWTASVLAEVVAHIGAHQATPTRTEVRHIFWVSGQIMAASAIPLLLLLLSSLGLLRLHDAVWAGVWVLVAEMGIFALLAVRRTTLTRGGRTVLVLALVVLGLLVVFLKTLAH